MSTQGTNVETEVAETIVVEQYYNVMPILGTELAKLMPTYLGYVPPKKDPSRRIPSNAEAAEQIKHGLPETVLPKDLSDDGYFIEQKEREYILALFHENDKLDKVPQGTAFPEGHPLYGKKTSNEVFKDDHGNIYIVHNKELLGEGKFGKVAVAQALYTPKPGLVKEKGFYACKVQTIVPGNSVKSIQAELDKNAIFDLHLGHMHSIETRPKVKKNVTEEERAPVQTNEETVKAIETGSFVHRDDDAPEEPIETGSFVHRDDDTPEEPIETGTFVHREDESHTKSFETGTFVHREDEPPTKSFETGTFVHREDESPTKSFETGTFVHQEDESAVKETSAQQENKEAYVPAFLKRTLNTTLELQSAASKIPPKTLKEMLENTPPPKEITSEEDLQDFGIEKYLNIFEQMTAEVEKVHAKGILHNDIKAENFLLDRTGILRLVDFGTSKSIHDPLPAPHKFKEGSPTNIAPECYHKDYNEPLSTKQDIYGLNRTFGYLMANEMMDYAPDAYEDRLPTHPDNIPGHVDRKILNTPYLENFTFKNQHKHPHTQAINEMLQLMHRMNSYDVASRPEASEIKATLSAIKKNYQVRMEERQKIKDAIKNVDFKGPQIGQVFQLRQAIEKYNQQMLDEWKAKPAGNRGQKPLPLRIPDVDELKGILIEREKEKKAVLEAKKEGPIAGAKGAAVSEGVIGTSGTVASVPEAVAAAPRPIEEVESVALKLDLAVKAEPPIVVLESATKAEPVALAEPVSNEEVESVALVLDLAVKAEPPIVVLESATKAEHAALAEPVAVDPAQVGVQPAQDATTDIPEASDFTEAELVAMNEYILQKMNSTSDPVILQPGSSIDVPEGHVLQGKKLPFAVVKDSSGTIAVGDPSQVLGKGSFGTVIKGVVLFSPNLEIKEGSECAMKSQRVEGNTANETQILKRVGLCYGDVAYQTPDGEMQCIIMPYIPGREMSKVIESYEGYKGSKVQESLEEELSTQTERFGSADLGTMIESANLVGSPAPAPMVPASGTVVSESAESAPAVPASGTVVSESAEPAAPAVPASGTVVYESAAPTAPASGTVVYESPAPAVPASGTVVYESAESEPAVRASGTVVYESAAPTVPASGTVVYESPAPAVPASGTVVYESAAPTAPASGTVVYESPAPAVPASGTVVYESPTPVAPPSGTVVNESPQVENTIDSSIVATSPAREPTPIDTAVDDGIVRQPGYEKPFKNIPAPSDTSFSNVDIWLSRFRNIATEVDERAHQHGIAHLDLKPENLILSDDGKVTLIDFGVSEIIDEKNIPLGKGTVQFMAPEMIDLRNRESHTTKQDMYSMGRTFEALMFREMKAYYPEAYVKRTYDDSTVRAMYDKGVNVLEMTYGNYLDRFYFENSNDDPHVEATNEMLKVIYELKTPDRKMRPEAKEVAERLDKIQARYHERMAQQASGLKTEAQVAEAQVPEAQVAEAQVAEAQVPEAQVPEAQVPEAQVPEAQVPEVSHITVFQPDAPVAKIAKQVEPEALQPLSEPDAPIAKIAKQVEPEALQPLSEPDAPVATIAEQIEPEALEPLSEPDAPIAKIGKQEEPEVLQPLSEPDIPVAIPEIQAEPQQLEPLPALEVDAPKILPAKKADPEPMNAVIEPIKAVPETIEAKTPQVEKAAAKEGIAKPTLQRMEGRRNIHEPELPKPKAGVMEGLDSFINKWSKVKAVQEREKRANSAVVEAKVPIVNPSEVKAPVIKTQEAKQNVLASPVERAKAAAERQYNDPNRVEINISGGLLFGKAVADQQRKDREKELAELRSERTVSQSPKSKKPTA